MATTTYRGLVPVQHTLSNGAVITAVASHVTPAITIHAAFQAGSVFDPQNHQGLAHFVSRTIDRGTSTRSADDIAIDLDNRGVSLNVSINRHIVSLVCTCLTEDFDAVLAVLGDIAMHASFPADQVALRRSEVITAIRQDEDSPAVVSGEGLLRLLYPGHPYAWRPRGSVEGLEQIPDAALRAFHADRFAPDGLSLVLVGDIDPTRAITAADRVFGAWRGAAPAPALLPPVTTPIGRQRLVIPMMNKAQADIAYGFTTIVRSSPAYYAYWLMNNILGQYAMGGRLGDSIRERQGMAYYAFSSLDANVVPGPLSIRAGVNPANVDRAIASIDDELQRMAADGPTDRELEESKRYLIGSMPRTLETNTGIANFMQTVTFFNLGLDYHARMPGLLQQVTRDEVHEAARQTLVPARAAIVIAGPYQETAG